MKRITLLLLLFSTGFLSLAASAETKGKTDRFADKGHWALSTNLVSWANFGTINIGGSYALAQHAIIHADARINPWTFNSSRLTNHIYQQQKTFDLGFRWYFWYNYSGWWAGVKAQYENYTMGGLFNKDTVEKGDAFGLGIGGGYSLMIYKNLNIDFGLYGFGGPASYVRYSGQYQGLVQDSGNKWFFLPDELMISLIYVF